MVREIPKQQTQPTLLENKKKMRLPEPSIGGIRPKSDADGSRPIRNHNEKFHPQAVVRLYLAIVNRAIIDALDGGKNSPAAEQWLLSRDFDRLQGLFRRLRPSHRTRG